MAQALGYGYAAAQRTHSGRCGARARSDAGVLGHLTDAVTSRSVAWQAIVPGSPRTAALMPLLEAGLRIDGSAGALLLQTGRVRRFDRYLPMNFAMN